MFIILQFVHDSLCLQLSRGRFWLQMRERESFTKRRGTSLRATLRRSTMVCKPWYLMKMKSSVIRPTRSSIKNSNNLPEQDERTRESTEQWREFHYDGMHPPQEYNRQTIWDWEERGDAVRRQDARRETSFLLRPYTVETSAACFQTHFFNPCVVDFGFTCLGF